FVPAELPYERVIVRHGGVVEGPNAAGDSPTLVWRVISSSFPRRACPRMPSSGAGIRNEFTPGSPPPTKSLGGRLRGVATFSGDRAVAGPTPAGHSLNELVK